MDKEGNEDNEGNNNNNNLDAAVPVDVVIPSCLSFILT